MRVGIAIAEQRSGREIIGGEGGKLVLLVIKLNGLQKSRLGLPSVTQDVLGPSSSHPLSTLRLSTPIEFSLPFPSHHPSSVINNLISIAACYERHDFSLHCIHLQFLTPSLLPSPTRPPTLNSPSAISATRQRVSESPPTPYTSRLQFIPSPALRYQAGETAFEIPQGYLRRPSKASGLFLALGVDACCDSN